MVSEDKRPDHNQRDSEHGGQGADEAAREDLAAPQLDEEFILEMDDLAGASLADDLGDDWLLLVDEDSANGGPAAEQEASAAPALPIEAQDAPTSAEDEPEQADDPAVAASSDPMAPPAPPTAAVSATPEPEVAAGENSLFAHLGLDGDAEPTHEPTAPEPDVASIEAAAAAGRDFDDPASTIGADPMGATASSDSAMPETDDGLTPQDDVPPTIDVAELAGLTGTASGDFEEELAAKDALAFEVNSSADPELAGVDSPAADETEQVGASGSAWSDHDSVPGAAHAWETGVPSADADHFGSTEPLDEPAAAGPDLAAVTPGSNELPPELQPDFGIDTEDGWTTRVSGVVRQPEAPTPSLVEDGEDVPVDLSQALLDELETDERSRAPRAPFAVRRAAAAAVLLGLGGALAWQWLPSGGNDAETSPVDVATQTQPVTPGNTAGESDAELVTESSDEGESSVSQDPPPVEDPVVSETEVAEFQAVDPLPPAFVPPPVEVTSNERPADSEPLFEPEDFITRLEPPAIAPLKVGSEGGAESVPEAFAALKGKMVSLRLDNGHVFEGIVRRIGAGLVTLDDHGGQLTFGLSRVTFLDRDDPDLVADEQLREAMVTLTNGRRLRGKLVREDESFVVLRLASGSLSVPSAEVATVTYAGRIRF